MVFFFLSVVLTGKRITDNSLLFPGILLFALSISSFIVLVKVFNQNLIGDKILPQILDSIKIVFAFIIGCTCCVIEIKKKEKYQVKLLAQKDKRETIIKQEE